MKGGGGSLLSSSTSCGVNFIENLLAACLNQHHVLGLLLVVQKRKSQKIVETKNCMILSLIFTSDPPFDMLLSTLSIISTAALTG
jgi:hypothetical protein